MNNGINNPAAAQQRGGFFNRPGLLGGLAAGFLGAGLLGMLFGGGLFSGLGSLSSIVGLIIQLGLIYLVARLAMNWWARRNGTPAYANMAPPPGTGQQPYGTQTNANAAFGFGKGATQPPLEITPADYETFERRLSEIQTAWSNEDVAALHTLATPEMVSYFTEDLAANKSRNAVNKVTGVKLLQGDLAEAWREGPADYATLGLRYSLVDKTFDRASGHHGRWQRHAARGHGSVDLHPPPRQRLGIVRDPAGLMVFDPQIHQGAASCGAFFVFAAFARNLPWQ